MAAFTLSATAPDRAGSPPRAARSVPIPIRRTPDCWEWVGSRSQDGYGVVTIRDPRKVGRYAHRVVYEALVGPIPEGLTIDHLCRNRGCVNPDHLEPVTVRENTLRGVGPTAINARKDRCVRGHLFASAKITGTGWRRCEECKRMPSRPDALALT